MANTRSAIKRIQVNKRNQLQNRFYKSRLRTLTKKYFKLTYKYKTSQILDDKIQAQTLLNIIYSLIDKGTKRNVFHKNAASRKKSQLVGYFKAIQI